MQQTGPELCEELLTQIRRFKFNSLIFIKLVEALLAVSRESPYSYLLENLV